MYKYTHAQYLAPREDRSKLWVKVLDNFKSQGVLEVYLFCTDSLRGMIQVPPGDVSREPPEALHRPSQIRSSTEYVSYKDIKKVTDLKKVYAAVTLDKAEENLRKFGDDWRKQYPSCVRSWKENREVLSTLFEYPAEILKIIYTTNISRG